MTILQFHLQPLYQYELFHIYVKSVDTWSFWICVWEITWLSWRHRFRKAPISNCFPSTLKRKFLGFKERSRKPSFSRRISVDGSRPNRRNKVVFSTFSGVVWTGRECRLSTEDAQLNKHHTVDFTSWFFVNVIADDLMLVETSQRLVSNWHGSAAQSFKEIFTPSVCLKNWRL